MPEERASESQWHILLAFMSANPVFAVTASNEDSTAKAATAETWRQLASRLNAVENGAIKSPRKWREFWNTEKRSVRKKAHYQPGSRTGDFILARTLIRLTDKEEQILAILKKSAGQGEHGDVSTSADAMCLPSLALLTTSQAQRHYLSSPPASPSSATAQQANVTIQEVYGTDCDVASTPGWVLHLEERRLAVEERTAKAFETIAAGLAGLQATLDAMRQDVLADSYNRT